MVPCRILIDLRHSEPLSRTPTPLCGPTASPWSRALWPFANEYAQEADAATDAILQAKPDAVVKTKRVNEYPIMVKITTGRKTVWEGSQKDLFRKNGHRAKPVITAAVKAL